MKSKKLEESYNWVKIPDNLPRENLVMVKAKTTKSTIHPEDAEYPVRIFLPEELKEAARSLAQRPIGINHMAIIEGGFTVDANWNEKEQCIEALIFVPDYFMKKIKEGRIDKVSVEYTWREEEHTPQGTVFHGFVFNRIDFLEGINAGDSNTSIQPILMEGKKALMEGIIIKEETGETEVKEKLIQDGIDDASLSFFKKADEAMKKLGEPFAGFKDWDACIAYAKKKGATDPEAYCGHIKAQAEPKGEADDTCTPEKVLALPKGEASAISIIPEVEIKEANLKGKQIPEKPVSPMAQEPTPQSAIWQPIPKPLSPEDKITSIGAVADNKGPIVFEGMCPKCKSKHIMRIE